jgi:hypothetical protein
MTGGGSDDDDVDDDADDDDDDDDDDNVVVGDDGDDDDGVHLRFAGRPERSAGVGGEDCKTTTLSTPKSTWWT